MALYNEPQPHIIKDTDDEYFRTNTNLEKDQGEAPSFDKVSDPRLPGLFKFEYGGQLGYVSIPKGRIVSVAPDKAFKSLEDGKRYPGITLANGGKDVEEELAEHLAETDGETYVRAANKPVGVSTLNTYQNIENSFRGSRPGFITRKSIEVPLFNDFEKASQMEWGSAYGDFKPGDKVMSDETGRFVPWKEGKILNVEVEAETVDTDLVLDLPTAAYPDGESLELFIEVDGVLEDPEDSFSLDEKAGLITIDDTDPTITDGDTVHVRYRSILSNAEQIVGMVLNVNEELIPAGWMKYVTLEEGVFTDFGDRYTKPSGLTPELVEGTPVFDPTYGRFEKMVPRGIPGLLDGMNYIKEYSEGADGEYDEGPVEVGTINADAAWAEGDFINLRLREQYMPVEELLKVELVDSDGNREDITADVARADIYKRYNVSGLLRLKVDADTESFIETVAADSDIKDELKVVASFTARHQMPGMPTHLDWDGVIGSLDILLQL